MIRITLYLITGRAESHYVKSEEGISEIIAQLANPNGLLTFRENMDQDREPLDMVYPTRHIMKIVHSIVEE